MRSINKIVMTLAGLLLIVATVLKFQEMLSICIPSWQVNKLGFWESYEFFLIQIPLEFALGVWLVSGLFRKAAWSAGLVCYLGFIGVTLTKAITGAESCGCFGQIHVNPWITLAAIDVPLFLLLAIFRPKGTKLLPPPWPNLFYLLLIAVPTIGVMVASPAALVALKPDCIKAEDDQPDESAQLRLQMHQLKQALSEKEQEIDSLKAAILELQTKPVQDEPSASVPEITEQPAPIEQQTREIQQWDWLEFVIEDEVRQQIREGLVVVMMHRFDCEVCEEMVPRYSDYYREMTEQGMDEFKIVFLAIPPYGDEDHVPEDTTCITGQLSDEQKWGLMSPYVVALLDGELVKTSRHGNRALRRNRK
ncbi:MAG: MauE/DoxX family redox-associated membrane protein [Planctomycetota bacterium]